MQMKALRSRYFAKLSSSSMTSEGYCEASISVGMPGGYCLSQMRSMRLPQFTSIAAVRPLCRYCDAAGLFVTLGDATKAASLRRHGFRSAVLALLAALQPFLEALDHDEQRRHEQHRQAGRGDHSGEHRDADRLARARTRAGRDHQRHDREDERDRGHQDRAEPRLRGLDR